MRRHDVKALAAESTAMVAMVGVAETAWWMAVFLMEDVTGKSEEGESIGCAAPLIQRGTTWRLSGASAYSTRTMMMNWRGYLVEMDKRKMDDNRKGI